MTDYEGIQRVLDGSLHPELGFYEERMVKCVQIPVPKGEYPDDFRIKVHHLIRKTVAAYGVRTISWAEMVLPPEVIVSDEMIEPIFLFTSIIGHRVRMGTAAPHMSIGNRLMYPIHTNN